MTTTQHELTQQTIEQRLRQQFNPSFLHIIDDSDAHIGHSGAANGGGHFMLEIASDAFAGKTMLEQHRMIYQTLDDLMTKKIHALAIKIV